MPLFNVKTKNLKPRWLEKRKTWRLNFMVKGKIYSKTSKDYDEVTNWFNKILIELKIISENPLEKPCIRCEKSKPLTEFKASHKTEPNKCKDCLAQDYLKIKAKQIARGVYMKPPVWMADKNRNLVTRAIGLDRCCNQCKLIKVINDFGNNSKAKDGVSNTCKFCISELEHQKYINVRKGRLIKPSKTKYKQKPRSKEAIARRNKALAYNSLFLSDEYIYKLLFDYTLKGLSSSIKLTEDVKSLIVAKREMLLLTREIKERNTI